MELEIQQALMKQLQYASAELQSAILSMPFHRMDQVELHIGFVENHLKEARAFLERGKDT